MEWNCTEVRLIVVYGNPQCVEGYAARKNCFLVHVRRHRHIEEAHHHLFVRLPAPSHGLLRIGIVRIVLGVVIRRDRLNHVPAFKEARVAPADNSAASGSRSSPAATFRSVPSACTMLYSKRLPRRCICGKKLSSVASFGNVPRLNAVIVGLAAE